MVTALAATICTLRAARVFAGTRLRGGSAVGLPAEAMGTARGFRGRSPRPAPVDG